MLNPDGVINGNFRRSVIGKDLNRCWVMPDKNKEPTIFHAKQEIIKYKKRIAMFCDFHGH